MSLVGFHRVLIGVAVVFCAGYAIWEVVGYTRTGQLSSLLIGVVFAGLAFAFAYYLRNLSRLLGLTDGEDPARKDLPGS